MTDTLTFRRALMEHHLPALRSRESSQRTIQEARYAVACWERAGLAGVDLRELRDSHVADFREALSAAGQSATSFASRWASLRSILGTLESARLVFSVPVVRRRRKWASREDRPTAEEFDRLLRAVSAAKGPTRRTGVTPATFWRALYAVAYVACLRRTDLRQLAWSELSDDGIRLTPQRTSRYGKEVFVPDVGGVLAAVLAPLRTGRSPLVFPAGFHGDELGENVAAIAGVAGVPRERACLDAVRRAGLAAWAEADTVASGLVSGTSLLSRVAMPNGRRDVVADRDRAAAERTLRETASRFPLPASLEVLAVRPPGESGRPPIRPSRGTRSATR